MTRKEYLHPIIKNREILSLKSEIDNVIHLDKYTGKNSKKHFILLKKSIEKIRLAFEIKGKLKSDMEVSNILFPYNGDQILIVIKTRNNKLIFIVAGKVIKYEIESPYNVEGKMTIVETVEKDKELIKLLNSIFIDGSLIFWN
jgi:hypothetical protein